MPINSSTTYEAMTYQPSHQQYPIPGAMATTADFDLSSPAYEPKIAEATASKSRGTFLVS